MECAELYFTKCTQKGIKIEVMGKAESLPSYFNLDEAKVSYIVM